MSIIRFSNRALLFVAVVMMAMLAANSYAQESKLGKVDFPTSGPEEAQEHFLRGVAALHSFWYDEALKEFRESTKIAPDFMMGYWGEAMAHNHPIWGDPQETAAARKVLAKIKDMPKLTARERAYLEAVKILYGKGDKPARDKAYAAAMEKIHRDYPDDAEAALFHALALMGSVNAQDSTGLQTRLRAGEIAAKVYQKNPDHPGAAHYVIHAYDDPQNAAKALDAAQRYAKIAPEAYHALHMPSHIFLQLGMWPEAAASNEAAWEASEKWVKQENLSIAKRDYHSLHWLEYVYLQQGRYNEAEKLLALMQKSLAEGPQDDKYFMGFGMFSYASMAAAFVIETERWDSAAKLFEPLRAMAANGKAAEDKTADKKTDGKTANGKTADHKKAEGKAADDKGAHVHAGNSNPYQALIIYTQSLAIFTRGLAAAQKNSNEAQKSIAELQALAKQAGKQTLPGGMPLSRLLEIEESEIAAVAAAAKSNFDEAIILMQKATALEESTPSPSGPPILIKPSHEFFGEILLRANRPKEAVEQFAMALRRQPNRAHSLLGAARAAAKSGDTKAATAAYSKFVQQWQEAEAQLPELKEAQDYLKQHGTN